MKMRKKMLREDGLHLHREMGRPTRRILSGKGGWSGQGEMQWSRMGTEVLTRRNEAKKRENLSWKNESRVQSTPPREMENPRTAPATIRKEALGTLQLRT
ncbi:hypothetical protein NDU88_008671 [Pleurodeles waltl]|uniref:Uncharacterized protein n=1 Tax=Pleurodeles waltl TaxID=8319 RepID=A0AAV7NYM3_PLEWA|nr:hypothetical protein NDU88_008671 [Pleurodeles waltl]